MKHFYPAGNGLLKDDKPHVQRTRGVAEQFDRFENGVGRFDLHSLRSHPAEPEGGFRGVKFTSPSCPAFWTLISSSVEHLQNLFHGRPARTPAFWLSVHLNSQQYSNFQTLRDAHASNKIISSKLNAEQFLETLIPQTFLKSNLLPEVFVSF